MIALVTGAASGFGAEIARAFAREGARAVYLADLNEAGAQAVAAECGDAGVGVRCDVTVRADIDALVQRALHEQGRIDVVVNNAGVGTGGSLSEMAPDEIERCLDINLKGVIFGAQAAYPWLKASAPGSCLLNTASAAGISFCNFLIRFSGTGWLDRICGVPPLPCLAMFCQSATDCSGSKPALAIKSKPMTSASVSWMRLNGSTKPTCAPKPKALDSCALYWVFIAASATSATPKVAEMA